MFKLIYKLPQRYKVSIRQFARVYKVKDDLDKTSKADRAKVISKMLDYFKNSKMFVDNYDKIPKKLLCRKAKSDYFYIFDDQVADTIVKHIAPDLIKSGAPVFESCPGFGSVTERLLNVGVKCIHTFETDSTFRTYAKNIQEKHPSNVFYHHTDLLKIWKVAFQDLMDKGERMNILMEGINVKEWQESCVISVFGIAPSSTFLHHIVYSIIFQNGLVAWGRPELYLVLSPSMFVLLKDHQEAKYQNKTFAILTQLLFDVHFYDTIDRAACLPWQVNTVQLERLCNSYSLDVDKLYLTRLTPKRDLYNIFAPEDLKLLWFFVKRHMNNRNNRVLHCLEQWVPGCGPRIINMGYSVFTKFVDLNSQQVLELFLAFISWPEFPCCSFKHAMEDTLVKMETPSPLDPSEDEVDDDNGTSPTLSEDVLSR